MKRFLSSDAKLEALLKRQAGVNAALRAEKEKRKQREDRDRTRRVGIVGRAVLANAEESGEYKEFLKGILRATVTDEAEVKFLKAQGFYD